MLFSCYFDNFLSFKNECYFELSAPKNRVRSRYPGNYVKMDSGELVLRDAVIAGENAGGKSNFITVFKFLRSLFVRNDVSPHSYPNLIFSGNLRAMDCADDNMQSKLSSQKFEIEIAEGKTTYRYALALEAHGITTEELYRRNAKTKDYDLVFSTFPSSDEVLCNDCLESNSCTLKDKGVSSCRRFELLPGSALGIPTDLLDAVKELGSPSSDVLLVQTLATLGEPNCRAVVDWFSKELVIAFRDGGKFTIEGMAQDSLEAILHDQRYFDIFRLVDSSIIAIEIDKDRPFSDSIVIRESRDGTRYRRALRDDSTGVAQFAQWALAIYLVVYKNKTVFADEIDSAINPVLSDRVLSFINSHDHSGQFIYTTHNALALTLRTFMKEQIYFVSKDIETLQSSLYSLADFKDIRYDVKGEVYDFYLSGVLGGTLHG